jgi:hypothetical protein
MEPVTLHPRPDLSHLCPRLRLRDELLPLRELPPVGARERFPLAADLELAGGPRCAALGYKLLNRAIGLKLAKSEKRVQRHGNEDLDGVRLAVDFALGEPLDAGEVVDQLLQGHLEVRAEGLRLEGVDADIRIMGGEIFVIGEVENEFEALRVLGKHPTREFFVLPGGDDAFAGGDDEDHVLMVELEGMDKIIE